MNELTELNGGGQGKRRLRTWKLLLLIFVLAASARFVFATVAFPIVAERTGLNTGSDGYERIAANLLAGNGFRTRVDYARTTLRMPLYPGMLAGIFAVCGQKMWVVQLVHSLFGAGTAVIVAWLTLRWFGCWAGLAAGVMYALYPGDLVACSRFLAEPLAIFLMMVSVILFLRLLGGAGVGTAILVGIVFGLMGQTKSSFALLPPVLVCFLMIRKRFWWSPRRAICVLIAIVVPIVLISIPWVYRGYKLTGHVFYPSTLGGQGLMDGYFVTTGLGSGKSVADLLYEGRAEFRRIAEENGLELDPKDKYAWTFKTAGDEYRMDILMKEEFKRTVREDPLDFVKRSILGIPRFWYMGRTSKATTISLIMHVPLLLLAIVGSVRGLLRGRRELWLLIGIIAFFNVLNGVIDPLVRYAISAIPFIVILAAAALFQGVRGSVECSDAGACGGDDAENAIDVS